MKSKKIDLWDVLLFAIFVGMTYVTYMAPVWTDPSLSLRFIITLTDRTYGFLILTFVIKQLIQRSEASKK